MPTKNELLAVIREAQLMLNYSRDYAAADRRKVARELEEVYNSVSLIAEPVYGGLKSTFFGLAINTTGMNESEAPTFTVGHMTYRIPFGVCKKIFYLGNTRHARSSFGERSYFIDCIKEVRHCYGVGLKEAKDLVEHIAGQARFGVPQKA